MMKERFTAAFEEILAANRGGEVKNLLITDGNAEFLDDALYVLRCWAVKNGINLVEIDERDDSWLPEIQSRELFGKLDRPNTVLLIKNYATICWVSRDNNTPRNFLRDAAMNRHYGCGNDFVPSDELRNLLFVVALNDLSEMYWKEKEYSCFSVMHENDDKHAWINTKYSRLDCKMHPVMSIVNKTMYFVSDDETTFCVDIRDAFNWRRLKRPIRYCSANERTEIIHTYLENTLRDFHEQVECLILTMGKFGEEERFVLDGRRLKESFPNLCRVCCKEVFEIANANGINTLDPFELGELSFKLAQEGDFDMANSFVRKLWALDNKWARFFREVAKDYYRKPEDHTKVDPDDSVRVGTGMDHLFRIYLLGWYHAGDDFFDEEDKVFVTKHKDFNKAIDLLPIRFQNCSVDEVAKKLYWDFQHVKIDEAFDNTLFAKIFSEAENLSPGVSAKMREKYGEC